MAFNLVPPVFESVFENQQFQTESTMYSDTTAFTNATELDAYYAIASTSVGVTWTALPSYVSASLVTYPTYKNIRIQGQFPKFTNNSNWVSRPSADNTSTVSAATYESVVRPYYSAQRYNADPTADTSIALRFDAKNLGVVVATFYGSILVRNNWTRKRNQVIPFVQGGSSDAATFRFPGGSLGGYIGQDLFEPPALTGLLRIPVQFEFNAPGTSGYVTVTPTVSSMTFKLQAGGGQGGRGYVTNTYSASGGGGGSGGYYETSVAVTTGQQIFYYIGAGGSTATEGQGEATYIVLPSGQVITTGGGRRGDDGFLITGRTFARGGAAGAPVGNAGAPGTVATGSSNIPNQTGGKGGDAVDPNLGQGGAGGNYLINDAIGQQGTGYGAGGGGGGTDRGTRGPWDGGDGLGGRIGVNFVGSRYVFTDEVGVNTADYDVRTRAELFGWDGQTPLDATVTLLSGYYMYSTTTSAPAFSYAGLPDNTVVKLINNGGYILGKGGHGGGDQPQGQGLTTPGRPGGPAIVLNSNPLYITNTGYIAGGGGGGGAGLSGPAGGRSGGGGGAGGGSGGNAWFLDPNFGWQFYTGGAGGNPGLAGADGNTIGWSGGGGGRILPGTGGAGMTVSGQGGTITRARGGGSGGGGGGYLGQGGDGNWDGSFSNGTAGGSANNAAANTTLPPSSNFLGAAGGGGWGAAGGFNPYISSQGGSGGKAIETNGYDIYFSSNTGTIYGSVGGSSATRGFSTAVLQTTSNLVLRTFMTNSGWDGVSTASATLVGGIYVYGTGANPGVTVAGSWPGGIRINNYAIVMGQGGNGGSNSIGLPFSDGSDGTGQAGSPAISISTPISLLNAGTIAGGGGGGGGTQGAGGGGAGGGNGGPSRAYWRYTARYYPGGAGGGLGAAGSPGGMGLGGGTQPAGEFDSSGAAAGGGGRVFPGTGGAGGAVGIPATFGQARSGEGGSAGGGGGGNYFYATGATGGSGTDVGGTGQTVATPSSPAGTPTTVYSISGGGGGGWGAAGGSAGLGINPRTGGTGGKSIALNGNTVTYFRVGTLYGAVS